MNRSILYVNKSGIVSCHDVSQCTQVSGHLQGFSGDRFKTFRLDRILHEVQPGEDINILLAHYQGQHAQYTKANRAARGERLNPGGLRVLFTGFPANERLLLESLATANGMDVVKTVVRDLGILCVWGHIGPGNLARNGKVDKARDVGALVLDGEQLLTLIETGEITGWDDD